MRKTHLLRLHRLPMPIRDISFYDVVSFFFRWSHSSHDRTLPLFTHHCTGTLAVRRRLLRVAMLRIRVVLGHHHRAAHILRVRPLLRRRVVPRIHRILGALGHREAAAATAAATAAAAWQWPGAVKGHRHRGHRWHRGRRVPAAVAAAPPSSASAASVHPAILRLAKCVGQSMGDLSLPASKPFDVFACKALIPALAFLNTDSRLGLVCVVCCLTLKFTFFFFFFFVCFFFFFSRARRHAPRQQKGKRARRALEAAGDGAVRRASDGAAAVQTAARRHWCVAAHRVGVLILN
jgi:hypothetical protein